MTSRRISCSSTEELTEHSKRKSIRKRSIRPHVCQTCGRRFALLENLSRHQMIHTAQRPFPCTYCTKSFRLSQHLKEHIRTHTGEKPYKCNICGHAFCQISNLKSHQKTHTREKEYRCDICQKQFRRSFTLKQHRQIHFNSASRQTESKKFQPSPKLSQAAQTGSQAAIEDVANVAIRAEEDPKAKSEKPKESHTPARNSPPSLAHQQYSSPSSRSASTFNFDNPLLRRQQAMNLAPPPLLPLWNSVYGNEKNSLSTTHGIPYLDALTFDAFAKYSKSIGSAEFHSQIQNLFQSSKASPPKYSTLATEPTLLSTLHGGSDSALVNDKPHRPSSLAERTKPLCKSVGEMHQPNQPHDREQLYKSFSENIQSARLFDKSEFGRFTFSKTADLQKTVYTPEAKPKYHEAAASTTEVPKNLSSFDSNSNNFKPDNTKAVSPTQDYKWKKQLCEVWRKPASPEEARQRPKSEDVSSDAKETSLTKLKPSLTSNASAKSPTRAALFARKESHYSSSYEDDVFSPNSLASSSSSNSSREVSSTPEGVPPKSFSGKRTMSELSAAFQYPSTLAAKRVRKQAEAKSRYSIDLERSTYLLRSPPHSILPKETMSPLGGGSELPLKLSSSETMPKKPYPPLNMNSKPSNMFLFEKPFFDEKKKTEDLLPQDLSTDYSRLSLAADRAPSIDIPLSSGAELKSLTGQFSFVPLVTWKPFVTGWRNIYDGNVYPVHPQIESFATAALQQQTY